MIYGGVELSREPIDGHAPGGTGQKLSLESKLLKPFKSIARNLDFELGFGGHHQGLDTMLLRGFIVACSVRD